MTRVRIENLVRSYGAHAVLKDISLDIADGEFLVLLGPSGCGKSTLLSAIAGLDQVQAGRILFDDRDVTRLEPSAREIGMVFQSYALYPTMTARANMAFALRVVGASRAEQEERVRWAADLLQIGHLLDRKPGQLSGGQRQRVAIGRSLVRKARLFLFDEPLSNLDAKLRTEMRNEIKALHERLGVTFVFVTHDQIEAMTLATRIAVMDAGVIQQVDTPDEIYRRPATRFVADFVGAPAMSFLEGELVAPDRVRIGENTVAVPDYAWRSAPRTGSVVFGVRPERVSVAPVPGTATVAARLRGIEPHGADTLVWAELSGQRLSARLTPEAAAGLPQSLHLDFEIEGVSLFDPDSGARL
ncbi:ABC transporter ATP-binding protein [Histidinibacterium lentulum]|uniref:ABC transporter ATP-binding protein n=1 Tax=Histidinibacterium lentulum TaxID=2480588 RepID=A0A3N2QTH7_9RHOB|nr:ABC transporter ATP-binding protein [Histidinibacterium lentulum]ROT98514.1 ABC transporter ATP-binding protein [Histidinibacterium lentulum]